MQNHHRAHVQTRKTIGFFFGLLYRRLRFYALKLPFVYLMIPLGFLFEFIITFPFIVMVTIDARRKQ